MKRYRVNYKFLSFLLVYTVACSAQNTSPLPQQFWSEYRQAVIDNDMNKLADLTQYPLEIRGVDDSQPSTFYKRNQFAEIFTKALQQDVIELNGDQVITKTTKDKIIASETLVESDMMTKDSFRVDQLVFENKNGKWMLVRVYLEE